MIKKHWIAKDRTKRGKMIRDGLEQVAIGMYEKLGIKRVDVEFDNYKIPGHEDKVLVILGESEPKEYHISFLEPVE